MVSVTVFSWDCVSICGTRCWNCSRRQTCSSWTRRRNMVNWKCSNRRYRLVPYTLILWNLLDGSLKLSETWKHGDNDWLYRNQHRVSCQWNNCISNNWLLTDSSSSYSVSSGLFLTISIQNLELNYSSRRCFNIFHVGEKVDVIDMSVIIKRNIWAPIFYRT